MKHSSIRVHRRAFLKTASAGAALLGVGGIGLRGQESANNRLSVGCIGVGGRGSALMSEILAAADRENVQITAVCDVWQRNLEVAAARVKSKFGAEPRRFTRFEEMLAMPGLDAVVIATPDFSHGPILVKALGAKKDVYIEKPMTIELGYANQALDLARANERVVQAGTQRRSEGRFIGAARLIGTGVLGQVSRVSAAVYFNHARWATDVSNCKPGEVDWEAFLLDLPKRAFDAKLLRNWQLYRATSNGLPGLWMTHYADAVHMLTGAKYPNSAVALGGIYVWKDGREHTDTFHAVLDYPEGFLFEWGMGLGNSAGTRFTVNGTKGTVDLESWKLSAEGGSGPKFETVNIKEESGMGHMENWLQCLRSRKRPNADIQYGHQHAVATIMCAKALESGRRQRWDGVKREIVAG